MDDALLVVEDLAYKYSDGPQALRGVSFTLGRGERLGLVGPNGSGKSTLLLCLNGFLWGEGRVQLNGHHLDKRTVKKIRGRLGLVFQDADHQLFMPTLYDDIAFGPINQGFDAEVVEQRVQAALDQVGLADQADRAPHHLSGGQKRSAAIATVLSMRPELLMMDEPSSNLDPRSRRQLIRLLEAMGSTLFIATHDLEMILDLCGRVLLIDEGRVVADGPTGEILADARMMEDHGLEVPARFARSGGIESTSES